MMLRHLELVDAGRDAAARYAQSRTASWPFEGRG